MRSITRFLPLAAAVAALALPAAAQPGAAAAAPAARVIGAKLEAQPRVYRGPCPVVIKFVGSIETAGPSAVKYVFDRNDGGIDTIDRHFTLTAAPFHQPVDTTWTLGAPGMHYAGWEQIRIELPTASAGFKSNKAEFEITCDGAPGTQPGGGEKKPDLVVTEFGMKEWGACKPQSAVYTFQVTVKNQGTAPSPSSASLGNKALVQAMSSDYPGWGNGVFLNALAPGASQTVLIPVYYLQADPGFMVTHAPHPFNAIADPLGLVNESNEGNNTKGPINMGAPKGCPKPPQPTKHAQPGAAPPK
ncbi:MAG TPA: CARDB domain-containing protein [Thermoanaerobaculia bacterium]|jgi:hypothetical protein